MIADLQSGSLNLAWTQFIHSLEVIQPPTSPTVGAAQASNVLASLPPDKCHNELFSKAIQILDTEEPPRSNHEEGLNTRFEQWEIQVAVGLQYLSGANVKLMQDERSNGRGRTTFRIPHELTPDEIESVRLHLHTICEHCPMVPGHWSRAMVLLISRKVLEVLPPHPNLIGLPGPLASGNYEDGDMRFSVRVFTYDPEKFNEATSIQPRGGWSISKFVLSGDEVRKIGRIPGISPVYRAHLNSRDTQVETDLLHQATKALRWICSRLHGQVASKAAVKLQYYACREILGIPITDAMDVEGEPSKLEAYLYFY